VTFWPRYVALVILAEILLHIPFML